jgi:hypothetical protein
MDETTLRVLSGDFLDSRLPPVIIITMRRVCKRLCRPLRQYLTDFLRYKHVRVASMYISELALRRPYTERELFDMVRVVYAKMEFIRSTTKIGAVCAGSYPLHCLTEREAAKRAAVLPCTFQPGDIDIFCQDDEQFEATTVLVFQLAENLGCDLGCDLGAEDQIKWRGLWRGRHRHRPDIGAMGFHDWGYVAADEWTGCCPVADRGMFIEAAKNFKWRNKTYPHDSMVSVLDDCLPTLISQRSYKVTDSVHAHVPIKLPPVCHQLNRPAMCVNVIRVVDVRPSEEISKRDLLNSMDIITSFDLTIAAVSMTVDEGLDMQFVHLENTLRNLGKKSMQITPKFLFGVVPHTTFESPPRWDRRRSEPEFRRIYTDPLSGIYYTDKMRSTHAAQYERQYDAQLDHNITPSGKQSPLSWRSDAAVHTVLARLDKYLCRGYVLQDAAKYIAKYIAKPVRISSITYDF